MKVLVVSGGIPTEKEPLNGNFEFEQAEALSNAGLDVIFFALDLRSIRRKRRWGISEGESGRIKWYVISIPVGRIPIRFFCSIGSKALCLLYHKVFKNDKPDIIHAHFGEIGCISSSLSIKTHIPLVITEHSSDMNKTDIPPSFLNCVKRGYQHASKLIAVGTGLSNNIKETTGIDSVVIPNMLHLGVFESVSKRSHRGFRIVTTSSLIPLKRTKNLIDAVARIRNDYSDIYLDVIGDGPLREDLERRVRELGIDDQVVFHGYQNAEQIARIYEESDCFALVSSSETFGVVYTEALAAGLPVIATHCGGPDDFINSENGILIDVDNLDQTEQAIRYMRLHYKDYAEQELKLFIREHYAPHIIAQKLIDIYNSVLNEKN